MKRYENKQSYISNEDLITLARARQNYGHRNQMSVADEELKELAIVCSKFQRYSNDNTAVKELHEKAIDEIADVIICLDHIIEILSVADSEIRDRIVRKIARLSRWMEENPSFEHTTVDREVPEIEEGTPSRKGIPNHLLPSLNDKAQEIVIKKDKYCTEYCFKSTCEKELCADEGKLFFDSEIDRALGRL